MVLMFDPARWFGFISSILGVQTLAESRENLILTWMSDAVSLHLLSNIRLLPSMPYQICYLSEKESSLNGHSD